MEMAPKAGKHDHDWGEFLETCVIVVLAVSMGVTLVCSAIMAAVWCLWWVGSHTLGMMH